jgi:hypothetical protein
MDHGSVFRRCGCRDRATGRLLGARCPGLGSRRHGTWYFSVELPSSAEERRRVRRGGFASRSAAVAALEVLLGAAPGPVQGLRTGEWLERWLASRVSLPASTSRGYAAHVRGYLVPYLGGIPLGGLSAADVQGMFTAIIRGDAALGRPVSAATLRRIHATLRAALNAAVRAGLIAANPGRWPELPPVVRPRPQVWTPAMTARWEQEGWRPVVGVWTAGQTAQFLQLVRGHRLYALFHLVALRGLRRGEAAGLRWGDRVRAATGHPARAAARRGHPRPGRGDGPEGRARSAWARIDHPDRRHLHQRATRNRPRRCGQHCSPCCSPPGPSTRPGRARDRGGPEPRPVSIRPGRKIAAAGALAGPRDRNGQRASQQPRCAAGLTCGASGRRGRDFAPWLPSARAVACSVQRPRKSCQRPTASRSWLRRSSPEPGRKTSMDRRTAGSVYPRCGCRQGQTGARGGVSCPLLGQKGHGSWYFSLDLPRTVGGRRCRRAHRLCRPPDA